MPASDRLQEFQPEENGTQDQDGNKVPNRWVAVVAIIHLEDGREKNQEVKNTLAHEAEEPVRVSDRVPVFFFFIRETEEFLKKGERKSETVEYFPQSKRKAPLTICRRPKQQWSGCQRTRD